MKFTTEYKVYYGTSVNAHAQVNLEKIWQKAVTFMAKRIIALSSLYSYCLQPFGEASLYVSLACRAC
jgi:hypothetical protein